MKRSLIIHLGLPRMLERQLIEDRKNTMIDTSTIFFHDDPGNDQVGLVQIIPTTNTALTPITSIKEGDHMSRALNDANKTILTALMELEEGRDVQNVMSNMREMVKQNYDRIIHFPDFFAAIAKVADLEKCLPWEYAMCTTIHAILHINEKRKPAGDAWTPCAEHIVVEFAGGETWTNPEVNITGMTNDDAITAAIPELIAAVEAESDSP